MTDHRPATRDRLVGLRVIGFVVALALGAVGVWLIVVSRTQKPIELGILAGLWGLFIGTFVVFGGRRPMRGSRDPQPRPVAETALERRGESAVARAEDAAARQEFERRLEAMLQRELQAAVARETASLHEEIAALRSDLVEKVGGQLRLERIETTRLIGSDLEALQQELRRLQQSAGADGAAAGAPAGPGRGAVPARPLSGPRAIDETAPIPLEALRASLPPHPFAEPARTQPIRVTEPTVAPTVNSRSAPPARVVFEPPSTPPDVVPPAPDITAPDVIAPDVIAPDVIAPDVTGPSVTGPDVTAPAMGADPFAGLPRLRPFADFTLDGPAAGASTADDAPGENAASASRHADAVGADGEQPPSYSGRRRRNDGGGPNGGRHNRFAGENDDTSGGRRRADEAPATPSNDLLARLLARESSRR